MELVEQLKHVCAVYIGSMILKLICKAIHYINLVDKKEKK